MAIWGMQKYIVRCERRRDESRLYVVRKNLFLILHDAYINNNNYDNIGNAKIYSSLQSSLQEEPHDRAALHRLKNHFILIINNL